jgi:glycosyltransferase involved in cell wall biosynthesis
LVEDVPLVSVVIPAYNEGETIGHLLEDLLTIVHKIPSMEIIVVDDGSTDNTKKEVSKFPLVRCISNAKNMGKGAALVRGIGAAQGRVVVIQDADLEYPVTNIPRLLAPIRSGDAKVVYGSRFKGNCNGMSFSHFVGNLLLSRVTSLLYGGKVTDVMTGHKAFSNEVLRSFNLSENGFVVEVEMTVKVLRSQTRIFEVPVDYRRRTNGRAKIKYLDGFRVLFWLLRRMMEVN